MHGQRTLAPLQPASRAFPRRLRAASLAIIVLTCLCSGAFSAFAPGAVLDPRTIQSATLDNGLRLVVCEEEAAAVISVEVVVRAGAADDPPGREGTAHLLEHVLWAGAGDGDPRRRIEEVGGASNAGTLRDFTRFYATVPAGNLALAVDALAEIVLKERFDDDVVSRERAIIQEESAARLDYPRGILNELAFQALFGSDHPYGRPIEGKADTLAPISPPQLSLFHQTWYVPNNIAVVIVGNVDFEEARGAVESAFGALSPAPLPLREWPVPARPSPGGTRIVAAPFQEAYVMAAFVGPAALEHKEVCASDLLATVLAHIACGRLTTELMENRKLATGVGVDFLTQRALSLFGVWAACDPDNVPAVQEAIRSELRRLAEEAVPPEELATAKRLLAAGYAFGNETPADRASTLAFYEAIDSYRSAAQYLPRVRLLTPAELAEVAAWYAGEPAWIVLTPEAKQQ